MNRADAEKIRNQYRQLANYLSPLMVTISYKGRKQKRERTINTNIIRVIVRKVNSENENSWEVFVVLEPIVPISGVKILMRTLEAILTILPCYGADSSPKNSISSIE
jgi:hypothetical protein